LADPAIPVANNPFDLTADPFVDTSDEAFFFPAEQHVRALDFMGQSLWTRSRLAVVTADSGCGKSLLIRRLVRDLDERVVLAAVSRTHHHPREFLLDILRQFGFALEDEDKTDRRRLIERFLRHQASMGRICLLIVENVQAAHPLVVEELRQLATIEAEGARVLKVLMLGGPSLNHVLDSPRMAESLMSIAPRFALSALSEDQTGAYAAHRLRAAGSANPDVLLPHTLMQQIYACTGGVPAAINRLCSRALACAADEGLQTVTVTALERAIQELGLQNRALPAILQTAATADAQTWNVDGRVVISMQGLPDKEIALAGGRLLVGRGEDADVRIDSVFVSRYHALIVRDGGHDLMLDLGSTNGLVVNSRRVLRRALQHRDVIQVGPAKVTYLNTKAEPVTLPDPGETISFARPGFPVAAGDADSSVLAFGRPETNR
jgi:type II secretory pathway predicted ATPase ExeA